MSANIEGLGVFYLGREYDLSQKKQNEQPLLYDAKDLVTHGVCVGMTGSGKTGLCIGLIEEAALDGIPAILIDPKGDLANLLLTFPDLKPSDFEPWVNSDDATRKGVTPAQFAGQQADLWKKGLEKWGQSGERIAKLKAAADFAIYTPGSNAGIPVSALKSFDAPQGPAASDEELFRERVEATATSLLGLTGIDADPMQSREHVLLANLFDASWRKNQNLTLDTLIEQIQSPPFAKVGALELEAFYPSKERFKLAVALNNLLASPGFSAWTTGVPLDIASFLHTPQGKARVSIFSIAHLSDAQRMFFVSLLLNQIVAWMRQQPGTTSLRAIVYMDEIFGYFPPVSNPPSKMPLLTLLKQARAFGVGVVLATQNPVDLDYKGLANTGTWWIGRLQTDRDKSRLLDGLEGAAASTGGNFDRARMEQTLAGLGQRVFLMNNVHEDAPVVFESRWAMSYLRGPLTREQIKTLMDPVRGDTAAASGPAAQGPRVSSESDRVALCRVAIRYSDAKNKVDQECEVSLAAPVDGRTNMPTWDDASPVPGDEQDGTPPAPALLKTWKSELTAWLANNQKLELFRSDRLGLVSQPGESERDFRAHIDQQLREERDREVAALRLKYSTKTGTLEDRIRRAQAMQAKQQEQASQAKLSTVLQVGSSILGAFLGGSRKKILSPTSVTKIVTAGRAAGRAYQETQDVGRAEENVGALEQQLAELQAGLESEVQALQASYDPAATKLDPIVIRPKKTAIVVKGILIR